MKNRKYAVWNLDTGKKISEFEWKALVQSAPVVFSADSKRIALRIDADMQNMDGSLFGKNMIVVLDRDTGKLMKQIMLGKTPAGSLAYSSDNRILAAAIGTNIHLYDAESLKETRILKADGDQLIALAFSPAGKYIATGDAGGNVRLWDVAVHKLLITMIGFPSADGQKGSPAWYAYTPEFYHDWSTDAENLIRWRVDGKLYPADKFQKIYYRQNLLGHTGLSSRDFQVVLQFGMPASGTASDNQ